MVATIRGVNIQAYPYGRDGTPTTLDTFKRAFDELQQAGGEAVAINTVQYFYVPDGSVTPQKPPADYLSKRFIWPDPLKTLNPDLLYLVLLEGSARGLLMVDKPMVDCAYPRGVGGWRGAAHPGPGMAYTWKAAFHKLLKQHAEIAKEGRAYALALATEMYDATKTLGASFWSEQARYVRNQGYRGIVTYAANWGGYCLDAEYNRVRADSAWPAFDRIGIDAYFPLATEEVEVGQGYEQAVYEGWHRSYADPAWCARVDEDVLSLASDSSVIWFTEVGYRADAGAAVWPGNDPDQGAYPQSDEAQAACWRMFRRKWDGVLGAYFAWDWSLYPALADPRSHNIRGKAGATRVALARDWS